MGARITIDGYWSGGPPGGLQDVRVCVSNTNYRNLTSVQVWLWLVTPDGRNIWILRGVSLPNVSRYSSQCRRARFYMFSPYHSIQPTGTWTLRAWFRAYTSERGWITGETSAPIRIRPAGIVTVDLPSTITVTRGSEVRVRVTITSNFYGEYEIIAFGSTIWRGTLRSGESRTIERPIRIDWSPGTYRRTIIVRFRWLEMTSLPVIIFSRVYTINVEAPPVPPPTPRPGGGITSVTPSRVELRPGQSANVEINFWVRDGTFRLVANGQVLWQRTVSGYRSERVIYRVTAPASPGTYHRTIKLEIYRDKRWETIDSRTLTVIVSEVPTPKPIPPKPKPEEETQNFLIGLALIGGIAAATGLGIYMLTRKK